MSINISKHMKYWKNGAESNFETAEILLEKNKILEALFFAHLSLEKALKAHVIKDTKDIPPYTHDLPYLQKRTQLEYPEDINIFLATINRYAIEGRYPDMRLPTPNSELAEKYVQQAKEILSWLIKQL